MAEPVAQQRTAAFSPDAPGGAPDRWRMVLGVAAALAVIAGIYSRLRGLGAAPLAVDEYYLMRSTDNVLRSGWPHYLCGGWYTRGLLVQYTTALLRLGGLSPVVAPRLICALSSLLALPAAYILGRRAGGARVGLLILILLALSVWEIEVGRFGRMYAPFQAAFLWYLVYFVRFTVDGHTRALLPMAILTCVAPLLWEGAVFVALANFVALYLRWVDAGRLSRSEQVFGVIAVPLLLFSYWFVTTDFGIASNPLAFPPNYNPSMELDTPDTFQSLPEAQLGIRSHHAWLLALGVLALPILVLASRYIWGLRRRPLCALGLLVVIAAALLGQFAAAAAGLVLLAVLGQLTWRELASRPALPFWLALFVCAGFWIGYALVVLWPLAPPTLGRASHIAVTFYQLVHFPDIVDVAIRPWSRAVPILGAGLLVLLAASVVRQGLHKLQPLSTTRALLAVLLVLVFVAGVSSPPRLETRYLFFLYPVALIVSVVAVTEIFKLLSVSPAMQATTAVIVVLTGFALSEDFQPRHLWHIDSQTAALREDMSPGMAQHLIGRENTPGIQQWLQRNVAAGDQVISGYHSLDYYYPRISYFYTDWHEPAFEGWTCNRGRTERWTNLPLLYTPEALEAKIATSPRTFLVLFDYQRDRLLPLLGRFHPEVSWSGPFVSIVTVHHP